MTRPVYHCLVAAAAAALPGLMLSAGSHWPSFRGPNAAGVADATLLPVEVGPSRNLAWRTPVPAGTSSPVLGEAGIFLTASRGDELLTLAIDAVSGRIRWQRAVWRTRAEKLHRLNSPASATAATDGRNVYSFFGDFGLVSYGPDGDERWRLPLGPFSNLHGMGASPVLDGDRLILACDQDTGSFLLAVHKDTGRVLWRAERPDIVHGFATPSLFPSAGGKQIVIPESYQLSAYDAATGRRVWWVRGLSWQIKTTAVIDHDVIYATGWAPGADAGQRAELPPFDEVRREADANGDGKLSPEEVPARWKHAGSWSAIDLNRDGFLDDRDWAFYRARRASANVTLAVRPGDGTGDLTHSAILWRNERSVPQVASPLLYQGLLYTVKDGGILTALDARTGETRKQARVPGALDAYYASPVVADNKIWLLSENGKLAVIRPGPDWTVLAVNDLGEPGYATPAAAANQLYVRTAAALYCFALPAFVPVEDDPALPRVLLIGDSISIGYTPRVRELLRGKANVHRNPGNGGHTANGLARLAEWLGNGQWDVIHCNWGLHDQALDNGRHRVPLEQYEKNLAELFRRLKKASSRVIWATTTPVPEGNLSPERRPADTVAYNAAAVRVARQAGVEVNDLYSFALPRLQRIQRPANVHFTDEGSAELGEQVAKIILRR